MSRNARFILNIVIVLLVVGLLGGGVYYLTRPQKSPTVGESYTDDDVVKIYSYAPEELVGVDVKNQYGSYSLRREGGSWIMAGFEGETLDATALDYLVNTFSNVTGGENCIEKDPEDLSVYGLDEPSAVLTLTTTGGGRTFNIGAVTPDGSGSYFNTDASSDVYIMDSYLVAVIRLTAVDYMSIASSLEAESITSVRIEGPSGTLAVTMRPTGPRDQYSLLSYWDITEPERRSASNNDVTTRLLTPLAELENGVSGALEPTDENKASVGLDKPEYTVKITVDGALMTYEFSPAAGGYRYYTRTGADRIMRVDDEDCAFLMTGSYDVAEKLLVMLDIGLVSEINIDRHGAETRLSVVDGGGDKPAFYNGGIQMDEDAFREFYMQCVAIDVSGVLDGDPGGEPVGSIEYVLLGGETIKLTFTSYDDRNYAVGVNGEEYYTVAKKRADAIFDRTPDPAP